MRLRVAGVHPETQVDTGFDASLGLDLMQVLRRDKAVTVDVTDKSLAEIAALARAADKQIAKALAA